jgi:hypothetical protein
VCTLSPQPRFVFVTHFPPPAREHGGGNRTKNRRGSANLSQGQIADFEESSAPESRQNLHNLNFGAVGQLFICPQVPQAGR